MYIKLMNRKLSVVIRYCKNNTHITLISQLYLSRNQSFWDDCNRRGRHFIAMSTIISKQIPSNSRLHKKTNNVISVTANGMDI